jgi:rRNA processing protein Gar1
MTTQIPNDLEIASEFAQQDMAAQPLTKSVETKTETTNESEIKIEEVRYTFLFTCCHINILFTQMDLEDNIDAAIAGKQADQGYESSDLELSSDDDSSSSSEEDEDESSEDEKVDTKNKKKDDEEDELFPDGIVKTANEIVDVVVEKPDYQVKPETTLILAGTVFQVIESVVVIHCRPNSEFSTLDQGSLLVYEDRQVMGEVFETFGPVARPYYSVRFNDSKDIKCKVGDAVFYVPDYEKTKIVETEKLKQLKYTDASNAFDEEASEDVS